MHACPHWILAEYNALPISLKTRKSKINLTVFIPSLETISAEPGATPQTSLKSMTKLIAKLIVNE